MPTSASADLGVGSARPRNRYSFNENTTGVSDLTAMNVSNGARCITSMPASNSAKKLNVRGRNANAISFVSGSTVTNFKPCAASKSNVVAANWQNKMKFGAGIIVTATLFKTLSELPMAQYKTIIPSTRALAHKYVVVCAPSRRSPFALGDVGSKSESSLLSCRIGAYFAIFRARGVDKCRQAKRKSQGVETGTTTRR